MPSLRRRSGTGAEFAAVVRRLIELERRDRDDLLRLRKEFRPVADTTLFALLIDLMVLDTDKHLRILRFLAHHPG